MALGHRTPSCFSSSSCTDPENREFHLSVKGHCCLLPTAPLGLQFAGHVTRRGVISICPRSEVMMPPVVLASLVLCRSLPAPLPVSSPGRPRLALPKSPMSSCWTRDQARTRVGSPFGLKSKRYSALTIITPSASFSDTFYFPVVSKSTAEWEDELILLNPNP